MSDWLAPSYQQMSHVGVFLNQSNGDVTSRVVPQNSPVYGSQNMPPHYTHERGYGAQLVQENNHSNGFVPNRPNHFSANSPLENGYPQTGGERHYFPHSPGNAISNASSPYRADGINMLPSNRTSMRTNSMLSAIGAGSAANTPSVFDIIAKQQLHQNNVSKSSRRGSGNRRGSKTIVGTLTAVTNSLSRSKLKEADQGSCCNSDYTTSYNSIFTQIREVNRESKGEWEFLAKSFRILQSTALTTVVLFLVLFLPAVMVVLGVKHLHGCPKERYLPIYLLVGGCFGMLKMFTVIWRQIRERKNSESFDALDSENQSDFITDRSTQFTDVVLSLFLLAWFGYGNYLTWRIFMPNFESQMHAPSDWCEQSLYLFCVIQIVICYSIFVLFLWSMCCLCCARHVCCFTDKRKIIR